MPEHTDAAPQQATKSVETPEEQYIPSTEGAPALGGVWDTLQQGIGNQAVGRLVEARRAASAEDLTRVSPGQQAQIDAARGGGQSLDGAPGVRLHYGDNAAALAGGLNARAFTQGRDVFFGAGYNPSSDQGRATLAHELTHVGEGKTSVGTVQREGAPVAPDALPPDLSTAGQPNKTPDPNKKKALFTVTTDKGPLPGLTKKSAVALLRSSLTSLTKSVSAESGDHERVYRERQASIFTIAGGAIVDLFGADFPSIEPWKEIRNNLTAAEQQIDLAKSETSEMQAATMDENGKTVQAAGDLLQKAGAQFKDISAKWDAYRAQLDEAGATAVIAAPVIIVAVGVIIIVAAEVAPIALAEGGTEATAEAGVDALADTSVDVLADTQVNALATTEAAGGTTAAGVSTVTANAMADSLVGGTIQTLQAGGEAAALEFAGGATEATIDAAIPRLIQIVRLTPMGAPGYAIAKQALDILYMVYRGQMGLPPGGM